MPDLMRILIEVVFPDGLPWTPKAGGDYDKLLDGIAANHEVVRAFLSTLSDIRNPLKTVLLDDMERELGIPPNSLISEETRRQRAAEQKTGRSNNGSDDSLETALRNAGFDVYVYQNDPAVDPNDFLENAFQMVAGGDNAYAGRADAYAGRSGGEILVNGEIRFIQQVFTAVAGRIYAGDGSVAGQYETLNVTIYDYPVPTDPQYWPFVFFVGGPATYGYIESMINGDFETGDFTAWTANNSTIDNTNPASGTWCAKLIAAGADILGAESDSLDINPKRTYTIQISNDVTAYVAGSYKNIIEFRDNDDVLISEVELAEYAAITGGYDTVLKTIGPIASGADIIIPITACKIRLRHAWDGTPTGTAFMDDVSFKRTDKESLISIARATVDGAREDEFKRKILQYKPLHSWAALLVSYT